MISLMKICTKCKEDKNLDSFYKDKSRKSGVCPQCKDCMRESNKKYRQSKAGKISRSNYKKSINGKVAAKRYRESHREYFRAYGKTHKCREAKKKYIKSTPEIIKKMKARHKLNYAVESDKIKKGPCAICGEIIVHGHHTDYNKPLDVVWLCEPHHIEEHKLSKGAFTA